MNPKRAEVNHKIVQVEKSDSAKNSTSNSVPPAESSESISDSIDGKKVAQNAPTPFDVDVHRRNEICYTVRIVSGLTFAGWFVYCAKSVIIELSRSNPQGAVGAVTTTVVTTVVAAVFAVSSLSWVVLQSIRKSSRRQNSRWGVNLRHISQSKFGKTELHIENSGDVSKVESETTLESRMELETTGDQNE